MPGKSLFLALVSIVVVLTLLIPQLVGLQSFAQWGGMYTDHWCYIDLVSTDGTSRATMVADGTVNGQKRWAVVQHVPRSCIAWARSWCGENSPDGWPIQSVFARYQQKALAHGADICTLADDSSFSWFSR